jgi:acetolactate synthase-1/2/3 large subunit
MSIMDGGALVGKALAREGVEKAFVLCGGHIMPIFYGMRNAGIEIIDMRHEAAAVFAAIAYTRTSGKPTVVVTTAGPGVANTPVGMLEAQSLGTPLLQIGGAVAREKRDTGDLQDMNTLKLMESCSKWAQKITLAERIPEYIAMAYRHAFDLTPGPVYLEIPTDLLFAQVDEAKIVFPEKSRTSALPYGDPSLIEEAADLLTSAQRPAMVVGDGALFSLGDQAEAVKALSDHLKIPVAFSGSSCRGFFGSEYDHPLLRINALAFADVVLALGCRFDFRLGLGALISQEAKVIQVHTDPWQIGFNVRADIGIVGGIGPVAGQLLNAVKKRRKQPVFVSWVGPEAKPFRALLSEAYESDKVPLHPARCAGEVARFLEEEARDWTLVCDGGEAAVWMLIASVAGRPGQIQSTGPNGTIGTGPAYAIGAWSANRKPVLWYTGDGSFGFYAMEMDTMARLGIPVVCVISNDSAWGMIRLAERYLRPDEVETKGQCHVELAYMRAYEKMAALWDGYGECVKEPQAIIPAIRRAAENGKPSIINVEVDQVSLSPMIAGYANMVKPSN